MAALSVSEHNWNLTLFAMQVQLGKFTNQFTNKMFSLPQNQDKGHD
jgi:hypothetical protein